jgi:Tfp pilus assembly protein PilV
VIDAAHEPFGVVRRLDLVRRWGNDTSSRQSKESAELKWIKREKAELLQTNGTLKANYARKLNLSTYTGRAPATTGEGLVDQGVATSCPLVRLLFWTGW